MICTNLTITAELAPTFSCISALFSSTITIAWLSVTIQHHGNVSKSHAYTLCLYFFCFRLIFPLVMPGVVCARNTMDINSYQKATRHFETKSVINFSLLSLSSSSSFISTKLMDMTRFQKTNSVREKDYDFIREVSRHLH